MTHHGRQKPNKQNNSSPNTRHLRPKTEPAQEGLNYVDPLRLPHRGKLGAGASLRQAQVLQMQRLQGNRFVSRLLSKSTLHRTAANSQGLASTPTLVAVQSMGKLVIGYTNTLPGLQREDESDAGSSPEPATLSNSRFANIEALVSIAQGGKELTRKNNGVAVQAVQQALFDMAYPLPRFRVDGKLGTETGEATRRFREDSKLPPGTAVDAPAMVELDKKAPAEGATAKKSVDYDKLLADGKLTFTVALGYDEGGFHVIATEKMLEFFKDQGFTGKVGPDGLGLFSKQATFLVSDPDTGGFKGKIVKVQIRFITPDTKDAKAEFAKGLSQDDISIYKGHARYGTGPDFDDKKSAAENFTIGVGSALHKAGKLKRPPGKDSSWYYGHQKMKKVLDRRKNDLEEMQKEGKLDPKKYQVWFFNACATLHYLDELRSPALAGSKDRKNLDIIGTRNSIYTHASLEVAKAFITSILNSETLDQMMANMQGSLDRWVDEKTAEGANLISQANMFFREGFGDNPSK